MSHFQCCSASTIKRHYGELRVKAWLYERLTEDRTSALYNQFRTALVDALGHRGNAARRKKLSQILHGEKAASPEEHIRVLLEKLLLEAFEQKADITKRSTAFKEGNKP